MTKYAQEFPRKANDEEKLVISGMTWTNVAELYGLSKKVNSLMTFMPAKEVVPQVTINMIMEEIKVIPSHSDA